MPFDGNKWNTDKMVSYQVRKLSFFVCLSECILTPRKCWRSSGRHFQRSNELRMPQMTRLRGGKYPGSSARLSPCIFWINWQRGSLTNTQVGFITSMSEQFCGSCNRLRMTADGNLKVCCTHPCLKSSRYVAPTIHTCNPHVSKLNRFVFLAMLRSLWGTPWDKLMTILSSRR